jgi:hypothetical protein
MFSDKLELKKPAEISNRLQLCDELESTIPCSALLAEGENRKPKRLGVH